MITSMKKHDVIVVGAGPAGMAMALALGGHNVPRPLGVAVLDARDPHGAVAQGTDSRGTALTRATQQMMQALGAGEGLAAALQDMTDVIVTDAGAKPLPHSERPVLLSFTQEDSGGQGAAAMVENVALLRALLSAVERSPAISLFPNSAVQAVEAGPGLARVVTASGEEHKAALVIAADGRASPVRQMLGIGVSGRSYGQTALSFSVTHTQPHHGMAEEHFSAHGVFAYLPLPGPRGSIVWGETPEEAARLMALDEPEFNAALQARMGTRLGQVALDGKRNAYPLSLQLAERCRANRTALIGDASHGIHPLAGLGLNLGFKDVAVLADCVAEAFARGEDIGGDAVLQRFEQQRRFDILSTAMAMDGMNALFVNNNPLLGVLRDAGLQMVNRMPPVRRGLLSQAAGDSGSQPRLMQGLQPA